MYTSINSIQISNKKFSIKDKNGIRKIKFSSGLKREIERNIKNDTIIHINGIWSYPSYIGYKLAIK